MFRFIFTTLFNVREQDLHKAILLYYEPLFQFDISAKKEAIIKTNFKSHQFRFQLI